MIENTEDIEDSYDTEGILEDIPTLIFDNLSNRVLYGPKEDRLKKFFELVDLQNDFISERKAEKWDLLVKNFNCEARRRKEDIRLNFLCNRFPPSKILISLGLWKESNSVISNEHMQRLLRNDEFEVHHFDSESRQEYIGHFERDGDNAIKLIFEPA